MGKITGFLEISRKKPGRRPVDERVKDWKEFEGSLSEEDLEGQGARCMDCGIPFCHSGCPLGNIIPEWNDLTYQGKPERALTRLHSTNNFPEFTGRICPAPCEEACTLNIENSPVSIKQIERQIIDSAVARGDGLKPIIAARKTGKTIAVIGSGPAGMACAQQLARAGHSPTLFERANRIGGLLRYGIPNFKLDKSLIDARMEQMEAEGVVFKTNTNVGVDVSVDELKKSFDVVVLSGGATQPRDLPLPGRDLKGVHFAMDFLTEQTRVYQGDTIPNQIHAGGKNVIVLGGGDTGSDCVGTSNRHGAKSVHQFELMPRPPETRSDDMPWPYWPMIMRTSSSHDEGAERDWSINTVRFSGDDKGNLTKLHGVRLKWTPVEGGRPKMQPIKGSEFEMHVDLVFLALGFLGPEKAGLLDSLGVELTERGNVKVKDEYETTVPGVFACGDLRRGQSLVVWAIWEGRECARGVDAYLRGESKLLTSPNTAPLAL